MCESHAAVRSSSELRPTRRDASSRRRSAAGSAAAGGAAHGVVIVDHSLPAPVPLGESKHLGEAMAPIAHPLWIHTA